MNIEEMLSKKVPLPSITDLVGSLPQMSVPTYLDIQSTNLNDQSSQNAVDQSQTQFYRQTSSQSQFQNQEIMSSSNLFQNNVNQNSQQNIGVYDRQQKQNFGQQQNAQGISFHANMNIQQQQQQQQLQQNAQGISFNTNMNIQQQQQQLQQLHQQLQIQHLQQIEQQQQNQQKIQPQENNKKFNLKLELPQNQPDEANEGTALDSGRSAPYTLHDDLSIFKVVASYYGFGFHGKIPWSFWQTYKRATGSSRSNSSLYHHWNGAMKKKYDAFISNGRLSDCILWLETAVMAEQSPAIASNQPNSQNSFQQQNLSQMTHAGAPLCHNRSQPSIPLVVGQQDIAQEQVLSLVRTTSCINDASLPFAQLH